ncbi:hypothetical protein NMY22_g9801 [Coprinellus aureogranulatus]|nr:hypothetical protein NMY22_g9801 [Coprinellus aureogranulatus]
MTDSESTRLDAPACALKSERDSDDPNEIGAEPPIRHSKYYFDDTTVIFQVEGGVLFKVHKHFLQRESSVFQSMFSCPPESAGPEGTADNKPIVLPEVKAEEFEALLDYFYEPPRSLENALPSSWLCKEATAENEEGKAEQTFTAMRLLNLLSVAHRFDFENARYFAIEGLEKRMSQFTPVDRILLSRRFDVDQWLRPAYVDLCRREKSLSIAEAQQLGLETTTLIAQAREAFVEEKIERRHCRRSSSPPEVVYVDGRVVRLQSPREDPFQLAAKRIISSIFFPAVGSGVEQAEFGDVE